MFNLLCVDASVLVEDSALIDRRKRRDLQGHAEASATIRLSGAEKTARKRSSFRHNLLRVIQGAKSGTKEWCRSLTTRCTYTNVEILRCRRVLVID